jgi:hypothetical protein
MRRWHEDEAVTRREYTTVALIVGNIRPAGHDG